MNIDAAIAELQKRIKAASPNAVVRIRKRSEEEASIRAYAPATDESAIKAATADMTLNLLTEQGLDVQVLVYDIATSLPPEQAHA